jgi:hypothetical protein
MSGVNAARQIGRELGAQFRDPKLPIRIILRGGLVVIVEGIFLGPLGFSLWKIWQARQSHLDGGMILWGGAAGFLVLILLGIVRRIGGSHGFRRGYRISESAFGFWIGMPGGIMMLVATTEILADASSREDLGSAAVTLGIAVVMLIWAITAHLSAVRLELYGTVKLENLGRDSQSI